MEAILELFVALVSALIEAAVTIAVGVASLCIQFAMFLLLAVTEGFRPAVEQVRKRRQEQRDTQKPVASVPPPAAIPATQATSGNSSAPTEQMESVSKPQPLPKSVPRSLFASEQGIIIALVLVSLLVWGVWTAISERVRVARIVATEQLAQKWVDQFADEREKGQEFPDKQELPVRDAWKQPLQLFVDDTLIGTLLVVRSAGPDRRTGTIDDILKVRTVGKNVPQIAKEVAEKVPQKVIDKLMNKFRQQPVPDQK